MVARLRSHWNPVVQLPILAVIAYGLWVLLAPSSHAQDLVGLLGVFAARAAAAVSLLAAARRLPDQHIWRLIGVGIALWAAAAGIDLVIRVVTSAPPELPAVSDWFYFAGYLAALTGVVSYRRREPERFGRIREVLDVAILGLAVGALAWIIFIRPTLGVGLGEPIELFWSAIAPTLDMVLAVLFFRLALRSQTGLRVRVFVLFATAGLILAVADLANAYFRLQSAASAGGLVELAWLTAAVLTLNAGTRVREFAQQPATSERDRPPGRRIASRIDSLLPIALTYVVVGSAVLGWWLTQQLDWFAVAVSAVLTLLLVARQGVILGQSELRQYAALVNASVDLSFICDSRGQILLANPAMWEAVGRSQRDLMNSNLSDHFDAPELHSRILKPALTEGYSGEIGLRGPDGYSIPVLISLRPLRDELHAEPLIAGTAHDLSAIKQRETQLEAALRDVAEARRELQGLNLALEGKVQARTEELERTIAHLARLNDELKELDHLKSEFVALVSHELRAPLTNIRTGVELVLEKDPVLGTRQHEALELVRQETERLTSLVEAILDISTLEAGRFPLDLKPLQLQAIASEVIAQRADLDRLKPEIPDSLPSVQADEEGLKSVLSHLLDNAVKYAPEGDLLLRAEAEDAIVRVTLSDSGPGIPKDERERIFEMFHRLDNRDSREIYGHGLGLPMAKRLIEAMGGGIQAETGEQSGARFIFWLPQAKGE